MSDKLIQKREEAYILFEEYKDLLTPSQSKIFADYYLYDLSLSEIAENYSISKAAASDSLHTSLAKLLEFEDKLHLVSLKKKIREALEKNDISILKEVI